MSFFKPRKVEKNYDLLSSCSWYTPDVGGLFAVLGWFLVGMILASIVVMPIMFSGSIPMYYVMLIMYPLQFVAVFMFVRIKSSRNMAFEKGYALDSSHRQKVSNLSFRLKEDELFITVSSESSLNLEKGYFKSKAQFFAEVFGFKPVIREKKNL